MRLINNSMHWGWKVSFIVAAALIASVWINELVGSHTDAASLASSLLPMAIWLTARWVSMGDAIETFNANYPEIGRRLFRVARWAFFIWYCLLWLIGLPMSHPGSRLDLILVIALCSGLVSLVQWIIIGRVKLEVFLPWTKLGGSEIEAKEG